VETQTVGKHLFVYPTEALPYVAAGALDQRLFDVTELIADEYDDAHTNGLPLIVQYGGHASAHTATAAPAGPSVRAALPSIDGAATTAPLSGTAQIWQHLATPATLTRATSMAAKTDTLAPKARIEALDASPVFGNDISKIWLDGKVKAAL